MVLKGQVSLNIRRIIAVQKGTSLIKGILCNGGERSMKLNLPQILFTSFFIATVLTVSSSLINWEHRLYAGIFAGVISIAGSVLAKIIFKDKN
ncbi:hypothetical protein [Bacillus sp. 7884-1]|uniref:hypothetical protein n=1 Tax=Bacillus sp. 7884-1 TaxID=2021693 RepID=UPI000BA5A87A|nr:hypothetical protein [Bacillus sp. 7884-1]PAE31966.1 hypothetical protein CHI06_27370 [Bacillus sp. 7884-1]